MKKFKELSEDQKKSALQKYMQELDNIPKNEDWENKVLNYLRRSNVKFDKNGNVILEERIQPGMTFSVTSEGMTATSRHGTRRKEYKVIAQREEDKKWVCHRVKDNEYMQLSDTVYDHLTEEEILKYLKS